MVPSVERRESSRSKYVVQGIGSKDERVGTPCGLANRALPGDGITVPVDETEDADEESSSCGWFGIDERDPNWSSSSSSSSLKSGRPTGGCNVVAGIGIAVVPMAWLGA